MRAITASCFAAALTASSACLAQQWEFGLFAGYGASRDASITNATGTAKAGFQSQVVAGLVLGEDLYRRLGGEFRYTFRAGDLRLKSGGVEATREGQAHAFHYDLLLHATPKEARIRPYAAGGGGVKWYIGEGVERASQPLSSFAALTKTAQTVGLVTFGGGVKAMISERVLFRADFRDYVTPFPDRLFATPRTAKEHGWLHDFVTMAGISFVF